MAEDVWTIQRMLDWTVGYLQRKGDENPRLSSEWLLAEALHMRRVDLYMNFERPLSMEERDVYRDFVRRRGAGEPLQYITGEVAFRYIAVKVRSGVLIPRPETEVLVSEALALLPARERRRATDSLQESELAELLQAKTDGDRPAAPEQPRTVRVLDVCTGSGCIACSVAYERPDAQVFATDIESVAVQLAGENAQALDLADRVTVEQGDLCAPFLADGSETFDLVVSNPPYIPDNVMAELPREVNDFEPHVALAGGPDGLDLFRRLVPQALELLKPGGGFACELHETCLEDAADLARQAGFANVKVVHDLAGRPRVITATKG